ncbi:esterase-like activity of phytase family protein [Gordonia oryzae]|uniref:Esterase-like activity of phytase family protein n=1 Tax=Gordonia oryzae TaxID=2487349 RepID=A0A3N4G8E2_9ACTN|nr:esterase-like activity of phytase family protein [Gordonia oryzae]RPA58982.1 esterase-like activity of phytase family protein [Gordonia oryzae]
MRLRSWGATFVSALAVTLTIGSGVATAVPGSPVPGPSTVTSRYVDTEIMPGIPSFGAISGIDQTANGDYTMISTDVGRAGPARFYATHIDYYPSVGQLGVPRFTGGGTVLSPLNLPLLPGDAQFEGIRSVGGGYVVVSGGAHQFVRQIGPFGTFVRNLPLPAAWRPTRTSGVNGQNGLTGVAVGPSGQISVITAGGLRQDPGNAARLLTFGSGRGQSEYVYRTDPDKVAADVIAVNNTDFLVLERGRGRVTSIYWATTRGADAVTGKAKLSGSEKAMPKTGVFSANPLPRLVTGNMSAMAWGNWLPDVRGQNYRARMLYVVTNNMFAGPTRVHAIEVRFPRR